MTLLRNPHRHLRVGKNLKLNYGFFTIERVRHTPVKSKAPGYFYLWGIKVVKEGLIELRIMNWDKYNGRVDRPNCSWLRFQNNFFSDVKVLNLDDHEKLVLIFLLCEASKSNKTSFFVSYKQMKRFVDIKEQEFDKCMKTLASLHLVEFGNQLTPNCHPTDGRTDGTNGRTNETDGEITEPSLTPSVTQAAPIHPKCFDQILEVFKTRNIKPKLSTSWAHAFPEPEWVIQEINKAIAWENANMKSPKKDFGRFMTNWLNRGWDSRKVAPSHNRAEQRTQNNRAAGAAYLKKLSGEK